jgi:Flp pilus assembly pilin Flp
MHLKALAGVLSAFAPGQRLGYLAAPSKISSFALNGVPMSDLVLKFWTDDAAQDIAEYAVMLAVILVLVVATIRLVGTNANNAFSTVASSIQ